MLGYLYTSDYLINKNKCKTIDRKTTNGYQQLFPAAKPLPPLAEEKELLFQVFKSKTDAHKK